MHKELKTPVRLVKLCARPASDFAYLMEEISNQVLTSRDDHNALQVFIIDIHILPITCTVVAIEVGHKCSKIQTTAKNTCMASSLLLTI